VVFTLLLLVPQDFQTFTGIAWQTSQNVRTPNTLVIDPKEVLYSRSRASFSGVSIS
jgi:hypothetical protein